MELNVAKLVIASSKTNVELHKHVSLSFVCFDNITSYAALETFVPLGNVVNLLVENVVDPLAMVEVIQPTKLVEQIVVRRLVRQRHFPIADDHLVYLNKDACDIGGVIDEFIYLEISGSKLILYCI